MALKIINAHLPYGGGLQFPKRIVVHAMAEYVRYNKTYLHAPAFLNEYKYSAHLLVAPNGDVFRCRADNQIAYHAKSFNSNSLGIEFLVEGEHDYGSFLEAMKTDYITEAQYEAGLECIKHWVEEYDIKKGLINQHSTLSPGRKSDPGSGFPWAKLMGEIA